MITYFPPSIEHRRQEILFSFTQNKLIENVSQIIQLYTLFLPMLATLWNSRESDRSASTQGSDDTLQMLREQTNLKQQQNLISIMKTNANWCIFQTLFFYKRYYTSALVFIPIQFYFHCIGGRVFYYYSIFRPSWNCRLLTQNQQNALINRKWEKICHPSSSLFRYRISIF